MLFNLNIYAMERKYPNKKTAKLIVWLLALAMTIPALCAQTTQTEVEWTLLKEQDGVKILYAIGQCDNQNMLWLKAENSNAGFTMVHTVLDIIDGPEKHRVVSVMFDMEANTIKMMNCENLKDLYSPEEPVMVESSMEFMCMLIEMHVFIEP